MGREPKFAPLLRSFTFNHQERNSGYPQVCWVNEDISVCVLRQGTKKTNPGAEQRQQQRVRQLASIPSGEIRGAG